MGHALRLGALALTVVLVWTPLAHACPVCFGDPNAQMTKGMETGIWFLLAILGALQVGFGIFFLYLRRRARGFRDPLPRPFFRLVKG